MTNLHFSRHIMVIILFCASTLTLNTVMSAQGKEIVSQEQQGPFSRQDLLFVNATHIEEKKSEWLSYFSKQQIKRTIFYSSCCLTLLGGAYFFFWETPPEPNQSSAQNSQQQPPQKTRWGEIWFNERHTFKGVFLKAFRTSLALALSSIIVQAITYSANISGSLLLTKIKDALGFGEDFLFLSLTTAIMRFGNDLARSLQALSDESIQQSDTAFQEKMYESLLTNVFIHHYAFIRAFEHWIGFVYALFEIQENIDEQVKNTIQQSLFSLFTMLSILQKKEQEIINQKIFAKETIQNIIYMLQNICQQIVECAYRAGNMRYGSSFSFPSQDQ